MNRRAFTLLELLVAMAVVAVLAAFISPAYSRIAQRGRAAACLVNLRQLGAGLSLYLGEHNNAMPTLNGARGSKSDDVPVIDNTLNRYVGSAEAFACPADASGIAKKTGTSYFWNPALNGQAVAALSFFTVSDLSHIPILSDKEAFHPYEPNKVNFLYADGHATTDLKMFTSP